MDEEELLKIGLMCGTGWRISFNVKFSGWGLGKSEDFPSCPHVYKKRIESKTGYGKLKYEESTWYCPRVVDVAPDDPYHCSQICLDCLLDKLEELGIL